MPSALILRHVAFEDLGLFEPALRAQGWAPEYVEVGSDMLDPDALATVALLVVLGGPIGAYEEQTYPFLAQEVLALERRLAAGQPTLGICLGAQLMARALGARVYPGAHKEIGWAPVTLTEAGQASPLRVLGEAPTVLHWHGDTFDLPEGAQLLASSALYANQAFAYGPNALALQFHPEVSARGLERWFVGHAHELGATPGLSIAGLRADTRRFAPELVERTPEMLAQWLRGLDG